MDEVHMSPALARYIRLLDELLRQQAVYESLSEDIEEHFALALNDCRADMPPEDEAKIADLIAQRKNIAASASLDLVDAKAAQTDDTPLRRAA